MLKIGLISDELTRATLRNSGLKVLNISSYNWKKQIESFLPDIVLVESAWRGINNSWQNKIAKNEQSCKDFNANLKKLILYLEQNKIVSVFWNKEDPVHFDRFIDSAKLFSNILTIDNSSIPRYLSEGKKDVKIMPFFINPEIHNFKKFKKLDRTLFYGSFSNHIHEKRRLWQLNAFKVASQNNRLVVFDRNFFKRSQIYKYPRDNISLLLPKIPYRLTGYLAASFKINLSFSNFISETAFSRRLIEILACGSLVITNKTDAHKIFEEFIFQGEDEYEINECYQKIKRMKKNEYQNFTNAGSVSILEKYNLQKILIKEIEKIIE